MFPTHRPTNFFRSLIRRRGTKIAYTYAETETTNYAGETETTVSDEVYHVTYVASPNESSISTELGERYDADMFGFVVVDTPVEETIEDELGISHGYEIRYGGKAYEVETIEAEPRDEDAEYAVIALTRKTNT